LYPAGRWLVFHSFPELPSLTGNEGDPPFVLRILATVDVSEYMGYGDKNRSDDTSKQDDLEGFQCDAGPCSALSWGS